LRGLHNTYSVAEQRRLQVQHVLLFQLVLHKLHIFELCQVLSVLIKQASADLAVWLIFDYSIRLSMFAASAAAARRGSSIAVRRARLPHGSVQRRGMAGHGPLYVSVVHTNIAKAYLTLMFTWIGYRAYNDGAALLVSRSSICTLSSIRWPIMSYHRCKSIIASSFIGEPTCVERRNSTAFSSVALSFMQLISVSCHIASSRL
jgi:hypothetical protein